VVRDYSDPSGSIHHDLFSSTGQSQLVDIFVGATMAMVTNVIYVDILVVDGNNLFMSG
jgi:hypothetical protein